MLPIGHSHDDHDLLAFELSLHECMWRLRMSMAPDAVIRVAPNVHSSTVPEDDDDADMPELENSCASVSGIPPKTSADQLPTKKK